MAATVLQAPPTTRRIGNAAAASLALRVASLGFLFLAQLVLTRSLGAAAFGVFAFALAWMKALSVTVSLGMDRVVIREIAACDVRGDWAELQGWSQWTRKAFIGVSGATAAVAAIGFWWAIPDRQWLPVLWMALAILPFSGLMRSAQHVLAGLQRPLLAQAPQLLVQPLIFLAAIAIAVTTGRLTAASAMSLQLASAAAGAVCAIALLQHSLPTQVRRTRPQWTGGVRWPTILPMLVVTGALSLGASAPVLLLGIFEGPEAAGLMAVAKSLADLATIPGLAFGAVLAPLLGRLAAQGDRLELQRNVTLFARGVTLASIPVLILLAVFGEPLLGMFGAAFAGGTNAMIVLALGHVVGAAAGSNALLLVMTGNERAVVAASLAYVVATLISCALLIPLLGVDGAAVGAAGSLVLWNLLQASRARNLLGIRPTAFARMAKLPAGDGEGDMPAPVQAAAAGGGIDR